MSWRPQTAKCGSISICRSKQSSRTRGSGLEGMRIVSRTSVEQVGGMVPLCRRTDQSSLIWFTAFPRSNFSACATTSSAACSRNCAIVDDLLLRVACVTSPANADSMGLNRSETGAYSGSHWSNDNLAPISWIADTFDEAPLLPADRSHLLRHRWLDRACAQPHRLLASRAPRRN